MDFVVFSVVFALFFVGLTLAFQGFVGKEINPGGQPFTTLIDLDRPGIEHPPEPHPLRLMLIGLGLMVAAVVVGLIVL